MHYLDVWAVDRNLREIYISTPCFFSGQFQRFFQKGCNSPRLHRPCRLWLGYCSKKMALPRRKLKPTTQEIVNPGFRTENALARPSRNILGHHAFFQHRRPRFYINQYQSSGRAGTIELILTGRILHLERKYSQVSSGISEENADNILNILRAERVQGRQRRRKMT
jgi:hypothetical protein